MDRPFSRGEKVYDVTFENVQAGVRTCYLFRLANLHERYVLGTGDLSELALGWSTTVSATMSHYNVNAREPKTFIQHLIRWVVSSGQFESRVDEVLQSVLDTEITPELIPTGEEEELQSSEAKVGPFVLQDFSLFQVLRYGFRPSKIAFLAWHAWSDPDGGNWPPDSQRASDRRTRSRRFGTGCRYSYSGSTRSASSSARRCPTGPRCRTAGRCPRAGTGAPRRTCRHRPGSMRSSVTFPRSSACNTEDSDLRVGVVSIGIELVGSRFHAASGDSEPGRVVRCAKTV